MAEVLAKDVHRVSLSLPKKRATTTQYDKALVRFFEQVGAKNPRGRDHLGPGVPGYQRPCEPGAGEVRAAGRPRLCKGSAEETNLDL